MQKPLESLAHNKYSSCDTPVKADSVNIILSVWEGPTLKKVGGKITVNAPCNWLFFGLYKEVLNVRWCFVNLMMCLCKCTPEYKHGGKRKSNCLQWYENVQVSIIKYVK